MTSSLGANPAFRRLLVAAALGVLAAFPYTRFACAMLLVGFLPGLVVATRCRLSFSGTVGLAAALSPILYGIVVAAGMVLGLAPAIAAWMSAGVWTASFVVLGEPRIPGDRGERRALLYAAVVVLLAAGVALMLPLTSEWWRVRSDSWFHAAVFNRLALHGLPPIDPYFSPLALQYMYFYHIILLGVANIAGASAFYAMMILNASALAAYAFAFNWLAGFFTRSAGPRVLGVWCAVFAMNGLFFLFYPLRIARALVGKSQGEAVFRDLFAWSPVGRETAHRLLSVEGNQAFLLDKFMLGTALSLTLSLVCALLSLLILARRGRWGAWPNVALVATITGMLGLHTVIGASAVFATLSVLTLLLLVRARTDPGGPSYGRLFLLCVIAFALAVPYMLSIRSRGASDALVSVSFTGARHLMGWVASVLPVAILSIPFLRWTERQDKRELLTGRLFGELSLSATGIVAFWAGAAMLLATCIDLVANNETKFSFVIFVPVAALAVGGLARVWKSVRSRRLAIAFVFLTTVPLHVVYLIHAWRDPATLAVIDEERAGYKWIRNSTAIDAIFLDHAEMVRVPVLGARDQYWGTEAYARNWGYAPDEMNFRRALRDSMYTGGGPTPEQLAALRALERPVYVISRQLPDDPMSADERFRENPLYRGKFYTPVFVVFEMILEPSSRE